MLARLIDVVKRGAKSVFGFVVLYITFLAIYMALGGPDIVKLKLTDEELTYFCNLRLACERYASATDRYHTPFSSESITRYGKAWGFQYESIRYFADCVADDVKPEASGRDGLMVTAMIEATLKSLVERRPMKIAEVLDVKAR